MPNIKSAKKRVKVIKTKSLQNQMVKSQMKTVIRKFNESLAGDKAEAEMCYKAAVKKIDQAVSRGIIHKNTAARRKSRLAKAVNAVSSS